MTDVNPIVTETTPGEVVTGDQTVRPGGLVGPQDALPTQTEMALKDAYQTGTLEFLNRAFLWEMGLSLEVETEPLQPGEGENSRRFRRLFIRDHVPPQRITSRLPDGTLVLGERLLDAPFYEAFQRWLSNRAGTVR